LCLKPKQCRPAEVVRVLKRLGFYEVPRSSGTSHVRFKHPDGRSTVVPMHGGRDIPSGTLRAIIAQINLTVAAFNDLA
jgi:predicted RNA binding protein YcfA (HicA-like mRNA interferase family)